MNELTTEEKLNKIAKQSKNIYYSTKLFEESKSEKDEPKIFPRELIKGEGESEKHLWAVILKYKTLEGIPQEVILGTLGDIYQRKEKVIEIINLIKKQLKQNVTSEAGYENFEKLSMYVKNNDIPFKLTMEGKNILFIKGKENIEIERTFFENKQGKIENLYDNENLEKMRKEKNSEINEYIKESRIIQKWKERREKILKSFDTEEKKQKFLKGERITEFLQEMDENIEKQKDITASYLLEAYDENKSEDENPKLRLLKGYLKIKEKGLSIDIKRALEENENQYYKKIKEKEGEVSPKDYNKLEILDDYKTFFDLVKTAKDWNARVFALKLKKIDFDNLKKIIQFDDNDNKEIQKYIDLKEKMINEVQTDNIEINHNEYNSVKELSRFLVNSSIREKTKEDDEHVISGVYEYIKREIIASNLDDMEFYNYYAEKSHINVYNLPQNKEKTREIPISETTKRINEYINAREDKSNDSEDLENSK